MMLSSWDVSDTSSHLPPVDFNMLVPRTPQILRKEFQQLKFKLDSREDYFSNFTTQLFRYPGGGQGSSGIRGARHISPYQYLWVT